MRCALRCVRIARIIEKKKKKKKKLIALAARTRTHILAYHVKIWRWIIYKSLDGKTQIAQMPWRLLFIF